MKNFFGNFKGDLFGGITSGIVALPLALAFGVSSGLGPDAGLYGAIFIGFFAALFGGTPTQISGPTAPMTAVSVLIISGIIAANDGNVEKALPSILLVFLLAGLIQVILGIVKIGKYIKYIPYPIVSGFMTAIGVIILITQLLPALGYYPKEDMDYVNKFQPQAKEAILQKILKEEVGKDYLVLEDFSETEKRGSDITEAAIIDKSKTIAKNTAKSVYGTLKVLPRAIKNIDWKEFALALITIIIIFGFKRITKAIPSTLIALLTVSGAAYFLGLDYRSIEEIPSGFPIPHLEMFTNFSLDQVSPYFFTALSLAFLGAIDSLLTSIVADNMTKTNHNPNKELIGQGIGNSIASIFGGIPGAGATIRTVVNINAGGKGRLSGIVAALLLLIILLALGPIASQIPAAVLAGILITVGIGVMDYKGLKAIPNLPKSEIAIMFLVLILSIFWDLVSAVGIGLVLASLIFMKKMGDVTAGKSEVKRFKERDKKLWDDEIEFPDNLKDQVFIKHLYGPLFFGATNDIQQLSKQIPERAKLVILRMDHVPYIDQSGLYTMEDIILSLQQKGVQTIIVGIQKQPLYLLKRIDIVPDLIPEKCIFATFGMCLEWIRANVKDE